MSHRLRALDRCVWLLASVLAFPPPALGANFRTQSFLVTASTPESAQEVAECAERLRRQSAVDWLGHELTLWEEPCAISATVEAQLEAQGHTSYVFSRGRPVSWQICVQGTRRAILESVLPHEVLHAVFAAHFGRPLPRWAEEGACISMEQGTERGDLEWLLPNRLRRGRVLGLPELFATRTYPQDPLPWYAQSLSVVRFLLAHGGQREFVGFLEDGLRNTDWCATTRAHYGYQTLDDLQEAWLAWVRLGGGEPARLAADPSSLAVSPEGRTGSR